MKPNPEAIARAVAQILSAPVPNPFTEYASSGADIYSPSGGLVGSIRKDGVPCDKLCIRLVELGEIRDTKGGLRFRFADPSWGPIAGWEYSRDNGATWKPGFLDAILAMID